ncbi:MAG: hypothetical protein KKA79_09995 [Nanoarchaeota archaeon]|nr:hypothetical protein [Nanoarchaeota archaeon]
MKIYNKWKNLKPDVKVGLFSTAIYMATAFGLPAYAAVAQDSVKEEQLINKTDLSTILTLPQAEEVYKQKLTEYSTDKIIDHEEIKDLKSILEKEKQLFDSRKILLKNYSSTREKLAVNSKKIKRLERYLNFFKEPNNIFLNYLTHKKMGVEDMLSEKYPGIMDKDEIKMNVVYPADIKITNKEARNLIERVFEDVHVKISTEYNDNTLEDTYNILEEEYLQIKDIILLLKVMDDYKNLLEDINVGKITKESLEKQIQDIKSQEVLEWEKVMTSEEKEDTESYLSLSSDLDEKIRMFSQFLTYNDKVDYFVENFGDMNRFWADSLISMESRDSKPEYREYKSFFRNNKETIENSLNDYLKGEGLEATINDLKDPSKLKFHLALCLGINGFLLPMIRNLLIRKYVGFSGNVNYTEDKYLASAGAAAISWGIGIILTDGLAPWAYWVRMGTPLVLQPAKKILKIDW